MKVKLLIAIVVIAIVAVAAIPVTAWVQSMNNNTSGVVSQNTNTSGSSQSANVFVTSGSVTSISPLMLQDKNGATYTIDTASTKTADWFGGVIAMSDIKIGDKIWVNGTVNGTNISANMVVDQSLPAGSAEVSGNIMSVSGSGFVVQDSSGSQIMVSTDPATAYIKSDKSAATFSNVIVGQPVDVLGIMSGNSINARYVSIGAMPSASGS